MKNKGLTLVELLIVISIIIIATGTIVINSSSKNSIDLYNTTNTLKQNIVKAKEMAMSGVQGGTVTNYGIGVWVTGTSEYIIYKNSGAGYGYLAGTDIILDKIILEDGLTCSAGTNKGVLFVPPTPYVALCSNNTTCNTTSLQINVCKTNPSACKTVTVNAAGLID